MNCTAKITSILVTAILFVSSPSARSQETATGVAASESTIHIDKIPPVKVNIATSSAWSLKDSMPALVGLLGLLGAVYTVWRGRKNNEATLWQKSNETDLQSIQEKLDTFYGPFLQISEANNLLAREFRSRQPDSQFFRLLVKLFNKDWVQSLSQGDQAIVREICKNAEFLETFIRDRMGMVDEKLIPYFARASAHFRILTLAYKGELGTDPTHFARYVYPYQLNEVLQIDAQRLKRRRDAIRQHPSTPLGSIEDLTIPPTLELPEWPEPARQRIDISKVEPTPIS